MAASTARSAHQNLIDGIDVPTGVPLRSCSKFKAKTTHGEGLVRASFRLQGSVPLGSYIMGLRMEWTISRAKDSRPGI